MSKAPARLPVPVLEHPHWRVSIRPEAYIPDVIPSLSKCFEIVEKNRVRFRGWDYPHLSRHEQERGHGKTWVASWANFMGHFEYWRLYQSSQFLHLFSVRESTEPRWRQKLQAETESHLSHYRHVNWNDVPGFFSLTNFTYCVTEIIEFTTRMVQSGTYAGTVNISIELNGIQGFVLTTSWERAWFKYYAASEDALGIVGK